LSVQLISGGADITIANPLFGYKSIIQLPFDVQETDNGQIGIYDPGSTYDAYSCECEWILDSTEVSNLNSLLSDKDEGRASNTTSMVLSSSSGFFPFGPQRGDTGTFTIAFLKQDQIGIGEAPYKYFKLMATIANVGDFPSYSLPSESGQEEGTVTIGTITDNRMPIGLFKPTVEYQYWGQQHRDGSVSFFDRGSSGDNYKTDFNMSSNEAKAAAVLNHIIGTARGNNFNLITGSDHYPFGYDKGGSGTHSVKLINRRIEVEHEKHNRFNYKMKVAFVS
jgi:hypothetical protein